MRLSLATTREPRTTTRTTRTTTRTTWLFLAAAVTHVAHVVVPTSHAAEVVHVPVDERAILMELYGDTSGASWSSNSFWGQTDEDICNWFGVICGEGATTFPNTDGSGTDDAGGGWRKDRRHLQTAVLSSKVTALELEDNNLIGRIPDSLYTLPNLQKLVVSYNSNLDANMVNIGAASYLQTLNIRETATTSLHGLAILKDHLQVLHLSSISLGSVIPQDIWLLTNLRSLHLAQMGLSGTISSAIQSLVHLEEFNVYQNELTGVLPEQMKDLSKMKELTLSRNGFSGNLPAWLNGMIQLEELYLENNNFVGPLLPLDQLPNLRQLYVNFNELTGSIPDSFLQAVASSNNPGTVRVNLDGNFLAGRIHSSLDSLQSIPLDLTMADNQFTEISSQLCDNNMWFNEQANAPSSLDCNALVCAVGTYNSVGRATAQQSCQTCESGTFLGQTTCADRDDRGVLELLYEATEGFDWTNNDGWLNDDVNVCEWYGIRCWPDDDPDEDRRGRVRHVILGNNHLVGTIPSSIWSLETLTVLEVNRNKVVLSFQTMSDSPHMHQVDVSATDTVLFDGISSAPQFFKHLVADKLDIQGTIPQEIYDISTLTTLSMSECLLTGPIHSELGQLVSLQELYLYGNGLRGPIPDEIENLVDLTVLSLSKNALTGILPEGLKTLANLKALALTDQVSKGGGLSGEVSAFTENSALTTVLLGGNQLEGTIPGSLLSNADLDTSIAVDLSSNLLSGKVPGGLARFQQLDIYLNDNELSGLDQRLCSQDDWMGGNVREFGCDAILCPEFTTSPTGRRIYDNQECVDCTDTAALSFLGQSACGTDDHIKTERQVLTVLYEKCGGVNWHNSNNWVSKDSSVHHCDWYGIDCDEARSVVAISLGSNALIGMIPTVLYQLPNLERLSLFNNEINFSFQGIDSAKNLKTLVLDNTKISSLEGVGLARSLTELNVRSTRLQGLLPVDLSRMANLETLNVADNGLKGPLPDWIKQMASVKGLLMARNSFTGELPSFANMKDLTYLDLSSNKLTGMIANTFLLDVNTDEKVFCDLSNNRLIGTIPYSLEHIASLSIKITGNKIEGVDKRLCNIDAWNNGDVGDFGCDGILCPAGTWNNVGRRSENDPCLPCRKAKYMGASACSGALKRLASVQVFGTMTAIAATVFLLL